jgi:hypothetical protein
MSCPDCNLILNCVNSLRCFSSRDCKMESVISYRNWPKNPIMTPFLTDGVLLMVRNWKERCHAWSPIVMTSHVQTLSVLLFQDSTSTSTTLFVPSSGYMNWPCLACLQLRPDTLLACGYRQAIIPSHPFVPTILVSHSLKLMTSFIVFQISSSCRNLKTRFLLWGEGCNTPCYRRLNQVT